MTPFQEVVQKGDIDLLDGYPDVYVLTGRASSAGVSRLV
jgi:hypothetical protein